MNPELKNQKMRDLNRLVLDMNSISPKLALYATLKERAQKLANEIKETGGDPGALSKRAMTQVILAKRAARRAKKARGG